MIYSFCKSQLHIRGSTGILPSFKDVNFLQNHGLVSLAIRYFSGNGTDQHSFTVSYLINSCGLSPQSALALSKRVHFETSEKPDSVIGFFKNHGFSQTQIIELIKGAPELLVYNPEKTLLPKLQFFYSRGVSTSNLAKILSLSPNVLRYSLDSRIIPNFNFFKEFTCCDDDKVLAAYKRFPPVLESDFPSRFAPNLAILRECGVPELHIASKLVEQPRIFGVSHERFKRAVEELKKLDINPLKSNFLVALQALIQMNKSTLERKFSVYKEWGWSDEEIASAMGKWPSCIMLSEDKIKAIMNFYVNKVGLKSSYIAKRPCLLGYSLEKRIIPRFAVLNVLLSKGLIKKQIGPVTLLVRSEKKFLQTLVIPYDDPHLKKLYKEKLGISK